MLSCPAEHKDKFSVSLSLFFFLSTSLALSPCSFTCHVLDLREDRYYSNLEIARALFASLSLSVISSLTLSISFHLSLSVHTGNYVLQQVVLLETNRICSARTEDNFENGQFQEF
jgi:hypothetical protein